MYRRSPFRLIVLLLALTAMLGVATASASPAHFHAKPPATSCDICFTAQLASLEAKAIGAIPLVCPVQICLIAAAPDTRYRLFRTDPALTRGPPSPLV